MNGFQKFLCVVNRHEETDFFVFLAPVIFCHFLDVMDQKNGRSKKVIEVKNQFFHAHQPHEEIFEICSYRGLIFTPVCLIFGHLFLFSASTNQDRY